ncbi:uncharacterized protein [Miscanthus floridulus]|uniref:uncharacterized protein n=1 Tax=Miscanthus floridulus TaxID=154761 RepID=UPI0034598BEC
MKEMRLIHLNGQATSVLLSALDGDEYNRVIGVDVVKQIWDTLHLAHEGVDKVRKARIDLMMSKLNRFVILDGEGPQEMFDRLMTMVGKIRCYGCDELDDHKVVKIMLEAYSPRNETVVTLIRDKKKFEYFTSNGVLGRILTFDMRREEANERKKLGELQAKLEGIKINKQRFHKGLKKQGYKVVKRKFPNKKKRTCYNCGSIDHFIAKCPHEIKGNKYKKDKNEDKADHGKSKKYMGEAHIGYEWDSTIESSSEEDEKVATVAIHKPSSTPSLFNNMSNNNYYSPHICLMAKGEKDPGSRSSDPKGVGSILPNPSGESPIMSDPEGVDSALSDPESAGSTSSNLKSMSPTASGVPALCYLLLVWPPAEASTSHTIRWDGMERQDQLTMFAYGASDE